jgi:NAD(P)-dependent dehydrogenase (short-subunit alcohol dehydrogenase family)
MESNGGERRSILVTGCSSGIGRHCALRLHEAGWHVFATARKPADIAELASLGLEALYLDYAVENSIAEAFDRVVDLTGGTLDALFNNGAYAQAGAVEDIPIAALRQQFDANFFGWHSLTRLAVPVMRRQGHGRLVHCSSILGVVPYRWRGAYVASKYALEGLMSTQRQELRGSGIHVSLIEPGPIVSNFTKNAIAHFEQNIDVENSVHRDVYRSYLKRLNKGGGVNRFRLGPGAVFEKLSHALEAARPHEHYPVTFPARVIFIAKRMLPQRALDRLFARWD